MRWQRLFVILFSLILCFSVARAEDQPQTAANIQKDIIRAVTPSENAVVIGKKPDIKIEFLEPITPNSLVVILDGADITQLLLITDKGFEFTPVMVLPAGSHNLRIAATDKEGRQIQKNISFSTRHTITFEEAYSNNEASAIYDAILSEPDKFPNIPDSKVEGNLASNSKIKDKEWEFTFNTNVRYLDQNLPVMAPMQKGFEVANWVFNSSYTKDNMRLKASIGDVQVNETQYTAYGLARKGGVFSFQYDTVQLSTFSVQSQQFYGLKGIGIEGSLDDHIIGASGGVALFDRKMEFKAVYVTGGDLGGSSYGISTSAGAARGDVFGFLLTSDFFGNKLKTEFETDFSRYDPDTSDEFRSKSDNAYKLKLSGNLDAYNYEALYEYIGRDYAVVGNQMIQRDKQGLSLRGGANLGVHNVNIMFTRYNDNVKGDDLFPRIVNYQGNLDYSFNGIPNLPMGFNYQKSVQDSTREPAGAYKLSMHTDTVSGRINHVIDKLNLGFQTSYSMMNDKTSSNNDTTTLTCSFTPSYTLQDISVSSGFSFNQSQYHRTDLMTDTYTINLDVRTKFFKERGSFDIGSTYNIVKTNDGSVDNRNLNSNFRLAYNIKGLLKGFVNPTIALRGTYLKITDENYSRSNKDEFILFLVLATSVPFSF
jgi:hypothetical protein